MFSAPSQRPDQGVSVRLVFGKQRVSFMPNLQVTEFHRKTHAEDAQDENRNGETPGVAVRGACAGAGQGVGTTVVPASPSPSCSLGLGHRGWGRREGHAPTREAAWASGFPEQDRLLKDPLLQVSINAENT